MPCEPIIKKGKHTGWICRRSRAKPKPPPCYKCGKPSTKLCDFRNCGTRHHIDGFGRTVKTEWHNLNTCDRPMCDDCTNHHEPDTDYCDLHGNEMARLRTAHAEVLYKKQLAKFGIEEE